MKTLKYNLPIPPSLPFNKSGIEGVIGNIKRSRFIDNKLRVALGSGKDMVFLSPKSGTGVGFALAKRYWEETQSKDDLKFSWPLAAVYRLYKGELRNFFYYNAYEWLQWPQAVIECFGGYYRRWVLGPLRDGRMGLHKPLDFSINDYCELKLNSKGKLVRHGKHIRINGHAVVSIQSYRDGLLDGRSIRCFPNRTYTGTTIVKEDCYYKPVPGSDIASYKHGISTEFGSETPFRWHTANITLTRSVYHQGKKHGVEVVFSEGKLARQATYEKGVATAVREGEFLDKRYRGIDFKIPDVLKLRPVPAVRASGKEWIEVLQPEGISQEGGAVRFL